MDTDNDEYEDEEEEEEERDNVILNLAEYELIRNDRRKLWHKPSNEDFIKPWVKKCTCCENCDPVNEDVVCHHIYTCSCGCKCKCGNKWVENHVSFTFYSRSVSVYFNNLKYSMQCQDVKCGFCLVNKNADGGDKCIYFYKDTGMVYEELFDNLLLISESGSTYHSLHEILKKKFENYNNDNNNSHFMSVVYI